MGPRLRGDDSGWVCAKDTLNTHWIPAFRGNERDQRYIYPYTSDPGDFRYRLVIAFADQYASAPTVPVGL
jgi:hypothetical protein